MSAKSMTKQSKYFFIVLAIVLLIGMISAGAVLTAKSIASEVTAQNAAAYDTEATQGTFYSK